MEGAHRIELLEFPPVLDAVVAALEWDHREVEAIEGEAAPHEQSRCLRGQVGQVGHRRIAGTGLGDQLVNGRPDWPNAGLGIQSGGR